jgi:hypothetical protein
MHRTPAGVQLQAGHPAGIGALAGGEMISFE